MNYCRWLDCTARIFPIFWGLIGSWREWKSSQNKSVSERATLTRKGEKAPQSTSEYYMRGRQSPENQLVSNSKGSQSVWLVHILTWALITEKWRSSSGTNNNLLSFTFVFLPPLRLNPAFCTWEVQGEGGAGKWMRDWMHELSANMLR